MSAKTTWISVVVGLLGLSVLLQAVLLVVAISDPSFAIEPDYERKAAEWDEHQRQQRINEQLGWSVELATMPSNLPRHVDVRVSVADREGEPIDRARVDLETMHIARASQVTIARLEPAESGIYTATLPLRRSGRWEFRLTIRRGDETYTAILREDVLVTPP